MGTRVDMTIDDLKEESEAYCAANRAQADYIAYLQRRNSQLSARISITIKGLSSIDNQGCTNPFAGSGETCTNYGQARTERCWPCVARFAIDECQNVVVPKQEKAPDSES